MCLEDLGIIVYLCSLRGGSFPRPGRLAPTLSQAPSLPSSPGYHASQASTLPNHSIPHLAIHHTPPKTSAYLYEALVTTALHCLLLGLEPHCGPCCIKLDFSVLLLGPYYTNHYLGIQGLGSHCPFSLLHLLYSLGF